MTYPEAVEYLYSLLGEIRTENFGLARMRQLTIELGLPQRSYRVVHVAGTNGKGSTAAMIESGLRAAGFATGFFSSPHLVRINERVRLNTRNIDDDAFAAAVSEVRAASERLTSADDLGGRPTFFESITAVAFCAFRAASVDWAVVEVGLGGRLDATNVVDAELAVITPIAFDHERFLGKDLCAIAAEKAAIIKPGSKVVLGYQKAAVREQITEFACSAGAAEIGGAWRAEDVSEERGRYSFVACLPFNTGRQKRVPIEVALLGSHQRENAQTAVAALDSLGVVPEAITRGLRETRWPGRLQRTAGEPEILLDAAHNPAGAEALARFLTEHEAGRRIHLVFAASRDKALEEVAGNLFPLCHTVTITQFGVARSVRTETLAKIVDHLHSQISPAPGVSEALARARQAAEPQDLIVVAGSIFLVGEAMTALGIEP